MDSDQVHTLLSEMGVSYDIINHPAVYTVDEAKMHRDGMEDAVHAKNLFLKDSKKKQYYLVSLEANTAIKLKELRKMIGAKKLSFASSEQLLEYLGLKPGSVSPFGLLNDSNQEVIYVIDTNLWKADTVAFHPNVNTQTLVLSGHDFQQIVMSLGYDPIVLQL